MGSSAKCITFSKVLSCSYKLLLKVVLTLTHLSIDVFTYRSIYQSKCGSREKESKTSLQGIRAKSPSLADSKGLEKWGQIKRKSNLVRVGLRFEN